MPVSPDRTGNPSDRSYAGMVPQRDSDDHRAMLIHAWSLIAQQHWDDALDHLDSAPRLGSAGRMAQRTAANMRALHEHRPSVYRQLISLFPIDMQNRHYRPVRSKAGWKTIVVRTIEGDRLINPIDDPAAAAQRDAGKLAEPLKQDTPLLLCGIADGYFFETLSHRKREHAGGKVSALYLVEPEPDLLLANLALHDFSARQGPIASPWVEWFVGPGWQDDLVERFQEQWMLPVPGLVLGRKDMHGPLKEALSLIKDFRKQAAGRQREAALQHGVYTHRDQLARQLRGDAGRVPRALLIHSRFEDAPPDAADRLATGLASLGWDCHTLTEPADHHRMTPLPVWNTLGEIKPDLILVIGERWADRRDVIDPRIPIVRWVFDAEHSATSTAERSALNLRDFVLCHTNPLDGSPHGYPDRQVLPMPGVVDITGNLQHTAAANPDSAQSADLLYIGSGAGDPMTLLTEVTQRLANPSLSLLAQAVGEQMIADYQQGKAYPTRWHIDQLARELTPQVRGLKLSNKLYRQLAHILFVPFNEALYRQQTLGWAADAAEEVGLTLAIHGKGWHRNARFKPYAHSRPSTAERRDALIAEAKVNLHIAPSFCIDTKLMDGLSAGGFYLTRRHPADALLPELVGLLENYCPPSTETTAQALDTVEPRHRPQLERLLERAEWITDQGKGVDPIACVRACVRSGLLDKHHVALPRLDQCEFENADQLKQRLERFLNAPAKRLDITQKQRAALQHRLSFASGLARSIARIADLIDGEEAGG